MITVIKVPKRNNFIMPGNSVFNCFLPAFNLPPLGPKRKPKTKIPITTYMRSSNRFPNILKYYQILNNESKNLT